MSRSTRSTDVVDLYRDIDLGTVTTSMTINSPAPVIFAMYVAAAEDAGVDRARLGGTLQNDILKEYQAQKEFVFPPRPSMRLVRDVISFTAAEMPRWHPVSISGYHIREAGSTAAQELAFTVGQRLRVRRGRARGRARHRRVRPAAVVLLQRAHRLLRGDRQVPGRPPDLGALAAASGTERRARRSLQLRFHTQTAGVSLTAQQPEVNLVRTAIEALAGVLGGTQSLHTNSFDEALALPTEKAARLALRTQQVIAHETRVTNVADPLGGSWFVEELTDEMERQAEAIFAHVDELGGGSMLEGALVAIEQGWYQSEIAQAAYDLERKLNDGRHTMVGVTALPRGQRRAAARHPRDRPRVRGAAAQAARGGEGRPRRRGRRPLRSPASAPTPPTPRSTSMPALLDAARAYATVGETMDALADVFGRYRETPVL